MFSGHAKAFSLFARLTFLQYYIHSYGKHQFSDSSLQCFCNNLGLITTITEMMTQMITCPNNATNNDQDIIMAICQMAAACHLLQPTFLHVLGHQDKDLQCPLTIMEQHNVDCDCQAKQYTKAVRTASGYLRLFCIWCTI